MRPRILRVVKERVEQLKGDQPDISPMIVATEIQRSIMNECDLNTDPDRYMSYVPTPTLRYYNLCFNPGLQVWSKTRLHFTTKPCPEQEEVYCVDCENLVIYRHKTGQCQHSEYRKVDEEESE